MRHYVIRNTEDPLKHWYCVGWSMFNRDMFTQDQKDDNDLPSQAEWVEIDGPRITREE